MTTTSMPATLRTSSSGYKSTGLIHENTPSGSLFGLGLTSGSNLQAAAGAPALGTGDA